MSLLTTRSPLDIRLANLSDRDIKLLDTILNAIALAQVTPSCLSCEHFQGDETCKLAGKRPPAQVIVEGCERWSQDIPF